MAKVFIVDVDRCAGCHACQFACKDEHCDASWLPYAKQQPLTGQFWMKVKEIERGSVPKVMVTYVPHLCNHCDDAPCIKAAPDAVYKREDGMVIIDPEKAKGNKALVDSCPYHAIFWNEQEQLAQKCTGCAHLLDDGWKVPRCVEACSTGGLRFGDEEDFAEEIAQAEVMNPEYGTGARVYYLNKPKRFVAGELYDEAADEVLIDADVILYNPVTEEALYGKTDEFGDFWFRQVEPAYYTLYFQVEGYLPLAVEADARVKDAHVGSIALYKDLLSQ